VLPEARLQLRQLLDMERIGEKMPDLLLRVASQKVMWTC